MLLSATRERAAHRVFREHGVRDRPDLVAGRVVAHQHRDGLGEPELGVDDRGDVGGQGERDRDEATQPSRVP